MAKKAKTPAPVLRTVAGATETPTPPASEVDRSERLSIPLTADGNAIDWDRMRPGTRDKLKTLTGSTAAGATAATAIDPSMVGMIYGSIGMLMVAAARARGFTAEQSSVLIFTDAEKAALVEPTAKVLSKYAGSLGRWQDEILLTTLFGTIMMGKLSQLRKPATVIAMVPDVKPEPPEVQIDWDQKDGDK